MRVPSRRTVLIVGGTSAAVAFLLLLDRCEPSAEHLGERLTEMVGETVADTGLAELESTDERVVIVCPGPLGPDKSRESWTFSFAEVELEQARELMGEIAAYWESRAPEWVENRYSVRSQTHVENSPAVFLEIDGFGLGATWRSGQKDPFGMSGSAPCADHGDATSN